MPQRQRRGSLWIDVGEIIVLRPRTGMRARVRTGPSGRRRTPHRAIHPATRTIAVSEASAQPVSARPGGRAPVVREVRRVPDRNVVLGVEELPGDEFLLELAARGKE
jgi:hypothetical protein